MVVLAWLVGVTPGQEMVWPEKQAGVAGTSGGEANQASQARPTICVNHAIGIGKAGAGIWDMADFGIWNFANAAILNVADAGIGDVADGWIWNVADDGI